MSSSTSEQPSDDAAPHPWRVKLQQARFTHLLIALSLLLFLSPFVEVFGSFLGRTIASLCVVGLFALVLISAALAVSDSERHSRVALILAAACLILTLLGNTIDSPTPRIVQYVVTICFLSHVVRLIVRALFRLKTVDYDTIASSLCAYLLIGVTFAVVYSLVVELDNIAITIGGAAETSRAAFDFGDDDTAMSLYFSFVTLTTLGYGDITPKSMPARMLATTEALIGQIYLVVLVARLVGIHIASQRTDPRRR